MNMHGADADGQATRRRFLPMLGHTTGKRSAVTCALKCDNACFHPVPNTSRERVLPRRRRARRSRDADSCAGAVRQLGGRHRLRHRGRRAGRARCPGRRQARLRADRTRPGGVRPVRRPGRLPVEPDHPLGRPAVLRSRRVRSRPPDRRPPGAAVRLQQRLPRHHRRPLRPLRGPGGQPGVHEREHHVPARGNSRRARRAASHRDGGPRDGGRGTVPVREDAPVDATSSAPR